MRKMNSTSGKIIFTAVLAAFSSAICRRLVRIESLWTRKAVATDERLHNVLQQAEANGINTVFGRGLRHVQKYNAAGGKMQYIAEIPVALPMDQLVSYDQIGQDTKGGADVAGKDVELAAFAGVTVWCFFQYP